VSKFENTPMQELRKDLEKMIEPHLEHGYSNPTDEPFYTLDHIIYMVRKEYLLQEQSRLQEAWQAGYNRAMGEIALKELLKTAK